MSAETLKEPKPINIEERNLSERNHLLVHRIGPGQYDQQALADVDINLKTAVQEGGMPHAVSTVNRKYTNGQPELWMYKTDVENARSGYSYHYSEAAYKRVDIEVDEAAFQLRPGYMKFFVSPRMSSTDADEETARKEHLWADDAVRASWLVTDENNVVTERISQSLLVKDIPLQAWVNMFEDEDNPFGKAMAVNDPESALSIMKLHGELEIPLGMMPDGPVDLLRAVVTYIEDKQIMQSVFEQIEMFESDQDELDRQATYIAAEWRDFTIQMAESEVYGRATEELERFINSVKWSSEEYAIIEKHNFGDRYVMTDELASVIEAGKENTLWSRAGVLSGNASVLDQIDDSALKQIQQNEVRMYQAQQSNDMYLYNRIADHNNRIIASQSIRVGSGCAGENNVFGDLFNPETGMYEDKESAATRKELSWHGGKDKIHKGTCVNCKKKDQQVGAQNWCEKCITC